jgi:hypothetical protein
MARMTWAAVSCHPAASGSPSRIAFLLSDLCLDAALARSPANSSPSATWPGLHRLEIEMLMTQTADSSVRGTLDPKLPSPTQAHEIHGLTAGDPVAAEQMRALFGCGMHPLAELWQQLEGPDLTQRDYQDAATLGPPFKIVDGDASPFRLEVARRYAAINTVAGLPAAAPLPATDQARVRTEVAREFFLAADGREPIDARELAGQIAKDSRPQTQNGGGFRPDVLPGEVSVRVVRSPNLRWRPSSNAPTRPRSRTL